MTVSYVGGSYQLFIYILCKLIVSNLQVDGLIPYHGAMVGIDIPLLFI